MEFKQGRHTSESTLALYILTLPREVVRAVSREPDPAGGLRRRPPGHVRRFVAGSPGVRVGLRPLGRACGLALSVPKCVPLWCFSDAEVDTWVHEACLRLAGCAVRGGARYLGVELGPGARTCQWKTGVAKLLKRTAEIAKSGESLAARLLYRVYMVSFLGFHALFCARDARILEGHG